MSTGEHQAEGKAVTEESLTSGYSGQVFLAIAVGWLGLRLGRGVVAPLLPTVIEQLAISPFLAGAALTTMTGLNAVCQFLGGRFADAFTRKTALVAALAAMVVGLSVLSVSVTYPLFVVGMAAVGVGSGLFFIPMRAALADLFVERRGRAFGVNESIGAAGSVLASGVVVAVLAVAVWQGAFLPGLVLVAVGLVLLHQFSREEYVVSRVDLQLRETVGRVFGERHVRWLLVAYSLEMFVLQGAFNFLPTFLQRTKEFSPTLASASYGLLFVMGMVVMPISGTLSDRGERTTIAIGTLTVSAVGLAGVVAASTTWLIVASVALFAAGLLGFPPVIQAYLMDHFPDESMGRDFGGFKTIYIAAGSLSPIYVGFVASRFGYDPAFWSLVCCLFLSAALIGAVRTLID